MYRKRLGTTSIIEMTFVILVGAILSVSVLYLRDVVYSSRAQSVIDYIEKQDSMWREARDMGYGISSNSGNVGRLRFNNSCQELNPDDTTAVMIFDTVLDNGSWYYQLWETYTINCLYVILGLLPREIGIKIGKSLDAITIDQLPTETWYSVGIRKKDIWIGEYELSPTGVKGFDVYARVLKSNMLGASPVGDVLDAYFFDQKMNTNRQKISITTGLAANSEISRTCSGSCKARTNISGKLIHFIEVKGKDSIINRRYAQCSPNDGGCAMPKSAFTGLTHNTGIGPIENMTGSSCGNRKSTKNECILVTRRMQELAPWEDWDIIDNR